MTTGFPSLPSDGETIAELRELYRAAETRAARLRLLSVSGREMAEADANTIDAVIARCAERLAFFVGSRSAKIAAAGTNGGIAVKGPGQDGGILAAVVIEGVNSLDQIRDDEDRDAVAMQLELIGATMDRMRRDEERSDLLASLKERERRLEYTLEQVFSAQEEERRRVSHELHDGVAQSAAALVRILESSEQNRAKSDAANAVSPIGVARGLVSELRRVIAGLRPTLLDDLGLAAALQSLCEVLEAGGFAVTHHITAPRARLSALVETALFRVAQEAITNIQKHAGGPCRVVVEADLSSEPLLLRITDHGTGPSEATKTGTANAGRITGNNVGIEVMKERMAGIGGSLEWSAGAGGGVVVTAWLPGSLRK